MDAAAVNQPKPTASELLLEHCFALVHEPVRAPVRERLDAVLGHDFARRLLAALSPVR